MSKIMLPNMFRDPAVLMLLTVTVVTAIGTITLSESSTAEKIQNMKLGVYNPYREFNTWVNGIVFEFFQISFLPNLLKEKFGDDIGYYGSLYVRDFIGGTLLYWIGNTIWHICIYHIWVDALFTKKNKQLPKSDVIIDQMLLSQSAIIIYAGLPVVSELLIENNLTQTYFYIDQIGGWPYYFLFLAVYYTFVEIGIYWVHRTLHTNKFLYKYIHGLHHKYNKVS
jgi:lathosterol oxidase